MVEQSQTKGRDEMFCASCGAVIPQAARFCAQCGARMGHQPTSEPPQDVPQADAWRAVGKSKPAAITLAVFLGFWSWLYTYRRDGTKFWLGLAVAILLLVIGVATFFLIPVLYLWLFGTWVWAIADACTKSEQWYRSYDR